MLNLQLAFGNFGHQNLRTYKKTQRASKFYFKITKKEKMKLQINDVHEIYQPVQASVHIFGLEGLFGEKE